MSQARKPLLAVNAGNSNVQTALWDGSSFSSLRCVPASSFDESMLPDGLPCAAATVSLPRIEELLKRRGAFILSPAASCGLDLTRMDASTLGADRLANAIALAASGDLPALCIDFGTAITFELLDGDCSLLGGAIMPGRMLQRKALRDYTAKLPLVELKATPLSIPGSNTVDAICSGVDLGAVGAVRELVASAKALFPKQRLRCVACGGDASFFLNAMPGDFEEGGSFFTLLGVAKAWEMNVK